MRRFVIAAWLVACGGGQAQRIPADPPQAIAPARTPVQPPTDDAPVKPASLPVLDEATVIAQSRGWYAAFDRADDAALDQLGPTFVQFEDGRFYDRAITQKTFAAWRERKRSVPTREWSEERVFTAPGTAVFVGRAKETRPDTKKPLDGYNTLVWTYDGTRWLIAHSQWARAGLAAERERWNEIFEQGLGYNTKPNQLLIDTVKGRKPGTALDVAMGQGRNAVFLATQGWKTTGIDISDEGIRHAKAEATKHKVKLEALLADMDTYDFGKAKWDLITLIYAGSDEKIVERIKPALKKGGLFVSEYFHAESEAAKAGATGWATGQLAALFKDGFEILRDEVVEDNADWAGQRKTQLVRFVARKK